MSFTSQGRKAALLGVADDPLNRLDTGKLISDFGIISSDEQVSSAKQGGKAVLKGSIRISISGATVSKPANAIPNTFNGTITVQASGTRSRAGSLPLLCDGDHGFLFGVTQVSIGTGAAPQVVAEKVELIASAQDGVTAATPACSTRVANEKSTPNGAVIVPTGPLGRPLGGCFEYDSGDGWKDFDDGFIELSPQQVKRTKQVSLRLKSPPELVESSGRKKHGLAFTSFRISEKYANDFLLPISGGHVRLGTEIFDLEGNALPDPASRVFAANIDERLRTRDLHQSDKVGVAWEADFVSGGWSDQVDCLTTRENERGNENNFIIDTGLDIDLQIDGGQVPASMAVSLNDEHALLPAGQVVSVELVACQTVFPVSLTVEQIDSWKTHNYQGVLLEYTLGRSPKTNKKTLMFTDFHDSDRTNIVTAFVEIRGDDIGKLLQPSDIVNISLYLWSRRQDCRLVLREEFSAGELLGLHSSDVQGTAYQISTEWRFPDVSPTVEWGMMLELAASFSGIFSYRKYLESVKDGETEPVDLFLEAPPEDSPSALKLFEKTAKNAKTGGKWSGIAVKTAKQFVGTTSQIAKSLDGADSGTLEARTIAKWIDSSRTYIYTKNRKLIFPASLGLGRFGFVDAPQYDLVTSYTGKTRLGKEVKRLLDVSLGSASNKKLIGATINKLGRVSGVIKRTGYALNGINLLAASLNVTNGGWARGYQSIYGKRQGDVNWRTINYDWYFLLQWNSSFAAVQKSVISQRHFEETLLMIGGGIATAPLVQLIATALAAKTAIVGLAATVGLSLGTSKALNLGIEKRGSKQTRLASMITFDCAALALIRRVLDGLENNDRETLTFPIGRFFSSEGRPTNVLLESWLELFFRSHQAPLDFRKFYRFTKKEKTGWLVHGPSREVVATDWSISFRTMDDGPLKDELLTIGRYHASLLGLHLQAVAQLYRHLDSCPIQPELLSVVEFERKGEYLRAFSEAYAIDKELLNRMRLLQITTGAYRFNMNLRDSSLLFFNFDDTDSRFQGLIELIAKDFFEGKET